MTAEDLRKKLEKGAECVFARRPGEKGSVRGVFALTFDRRKGFHAVERSLKQVRRAASECGVLFLVFGETRIAPLSGLYGEGLVNELPEDASALEAFLQTLPRYDLTVRVRMQNTLKKIGFF